MIIHIQSVPHRLKWVEEMILPHFKKYECTTHIDVRYTGPRRSYFDMLGSLKSKEYNYRLHLQDDVYLAINLEGYLEELMEDMKTNNIDILTLFNANRKYMKEAVKYQKRLVPYEGNFYGMCGVIFSKKADDLQRESISTYDNKINDHTIEYNNHAKKNLKTFQVRESNDLFVYNVIKDKGLNIYSHAPTLVEHNEALPSTLGYNNNGTRNSGLFDVNFIKRRWEEKRLK